MFLIPPKVGRFSFSCFLLVLQRSNSEMIPCYVSAAFLNMIWKNYGIEEGQARRGEVLDAFFFVFDASKHGFAVSEASRVSSFCHSVLKHVYCTVCHVNNKHVLNKSTATQNTNIEQSLLLLLSTLPTPYS